LALYYGNLDLFAKDTKDTSTDTSTIEELTETKIQLEKYLNELKQYDSLNKHG